MLVKVLELPYWKVTLSQFGNQFTIKVYDHLL